ncbi:MAG: metallophosphoesterase [Acidobacteria bacterium RIFCSPLOWO2_12_FULL_54_10]|nr:MAG: metallophosphoesterase [Acidobacteria bacterium RIFCSPLOWO2_12_FULL_54_10]
MNILFVGDIFGKAGREILASHLADIVKQRSVDLVIVNGENSAAGFGITPSHVKEFLSLGAHVITSGNHIWDRREIMEYFPTEPRLLRPANFPDAPGQGLYVGTTASGIPFAVLNLQGRVFMATLDCPFRAADRELAKVPASCKIRIVDMHAEASSEKIGMGWYLDGRVTAVLGTHTHVPTADERVLPNGTAYITDVGMTGPADSIIGVVKEGILKRFLTQMPERFEAAEGDPRLMAVLIRADPETGRATSIERIHLRGD